MSSSHGVKDRHCRPIMETGDKRQETRDGRQETEDRRREMDDEDGG